MSLIHFTSEEYIKGDIQVEAGRDERFDRPDQTAHLPVSDDAARIDIRAAHDDLDLTGARAADQERGSHFELWRAFVRLISGFEK